MGLTVVTGWSPEGYVEYGQRFAETFDKYWPKDVNLVVYGEERVELPRGEFRLLSQIPGCVEFLVRNDNDIARGRKPAPGLHWKASRLAAGYNFKYDAWKFCRQGFIPYNASQYLKDGELLCWLDGDVVTHSYVPAGLVESLLPDSYDLAYLGRGDKHSEIGFQLYRMNTSSRDMLERFSNAYDRDVFYSLKEWHSAYVFDVARLGTSCRDLTNGSYGHVWFSFPLGKYTDHLKGKRKSLGYSPERGVA